jgi:hypothetical protein
MAEHSTHLHLPLCLLKGHFGFNGLVVIADQEFLGFLADLLFLVVAFEGQLAEEVAELVASVVGAEKLVVEEIYVSVISDDNVLGIAVVVGGDHLLCNHQFEVLLDAWIEYLFCELLADTECLRILLFTLFTDELKSCKHLFKLSLVLKGLG